MKKIEQMPEWEAGQRTTKQALRDERNLMADILDRVDTPVLVLDSQGRIVRFNRACEQLSGYRFDEVKDSFVWDRLLSSEEIEQVRGSFAGLKSEDFPNQSQTYWITRQGERRLVTWSNAALVDSQNRVRYVVATGIDVTAQPEDETALSKTTRRLETLAAERAQALKIAKRKLEREVGIRNEVEQALEDSAMWLRTIVETAPSGIICINEGGIIETFNRTAERLFGYQAIEVIGENIKLLMPSPYHEEHDEYIRRYLETGQQKVIGQRRELVGQRKDGSTFPIELAVNQVRIKDQQIFIGTVQDISRHKEAEEALHFQKTVLECQNEATLDGIVVVSPERKWLFHNQRFLDIWNFPAPPDGAVSSEDALAWAKSFFKDPEQELAKIAALYEQPGVTRQEEISLVDGRVFDRYTAPVRSADGIYYGRVWYYRDITEQKRAEAVLQESEKRFRRLVRDLHVGVVVHGPQAEIILSNSQALILLGLTEDQLMDKSSFDPGWNVVHEDGAPFPGETHPAVQALRSGQPVRNIVMGIYRPSSRDRVWLLVNAEPELDEAGRVKQVIVTFSDISQLKQTERALQEAKEAAEAANRAKSEFLTSMSHELRTPLNGILGYAQILKGDQSLSSTQLEDIGIIQQSGEHLLTLINDILDLSKIEAGRMELTPGEFHLPAFLQSLISLLQVRADQKNIVFNYEQPTTLPAGIRADERKLRQILINLLGNAIKFTDSGRVTFRVSLISETIASVGGRKDRDTGNVETVQTGQNVTGEAGRPTLDYIRFEVEDTGPGIAPDQLVEVFKPFQQIGDRAHYVEGTGLGLSISQRLAELMGARLHVDSRVEEGSHFWFDLPISEQEIWLKTSLAIDRKASGFEGERQRILVVDDKMDNRRLLIDGLIPLGFEVIEATEGRNGLARAKLYQPQAILVDLQMPGMNGLEMTRRLRKMEGEARTLIIGVSASALKQSQQQSQAAGCDDFIPKPVHLPHLLALLEAHLPIKFHYEAALKAQAAAELSDKVVPELIAPPPQTIEFLYELVTIGDIGTIHDQVAIIEELDEVYRPFAAELNHLARSYQLDRLQKFIEQYL